MHKLARHNLISLSVVPLLTGLLWTDCLVLAKQKDKAKDQAVTNAEGNNKKFELSDAAWSILKAKCEGPFKPVTLPFDAIEFNEGQPLASRNSDWSEKDIAEARLEGKKHPELVGAIEHMLEEHKKSIALRQQFQPTNLIVGEREKSLAKFVPYLKQETDDLAKSSGHQLYRIERDDQKKSDEDRCAELERKYKDVRLKERYKPIEGLLFMLPGASSTEAVKDLKHKLQPLGYDAFCVGSNKFTMEFHSEDEYRKFLKDNGLPARIMGSILPSEMSPDGTYMADHTMPPENFMMMCSPPSSQNFEFDPNKPLEPQHFFMRPGDTIEKLGPTSWRRHSKISITLNGEAGIGLITRQIAPENLITYVGTGGPNYNIENVMVADQVAKWNQDFGLDLLCLGFDRFSFQFKKLPADLSHFINEAWLFDPDLFEMPQAAGPIQAATIREQANQIKKTKTIQFWWD